MRNFLNILGLKSLMPTTKKNEDGTQFIINGNNSDLAIKWEMYKALQPSYLKGILSRKQKETYKVLSKELGMS